MFKKMLFLVLSATLALSACSTLEVRLDQTPTPSADSGEVATIVAATLAAIPSATAAPTATPTLEVPSVLPRSLYYLSSMGSETHTHQIYRLSKDGTTNTQITSETMGVIGFDVSPIDGQLVYSTDTQLVLTDASGKNRRVLAENSETSSPHWSPDGRTIAYANKGMYFYDLETGVSILMLNNDETNDYSPLDFSPDMSNLMIAIFSGKADVPRVERGIYNITSHTVSILVPSQPKGYRLCCSPSVWSSTSNYIYVSDWVAAGGMRTPGLWRYRMDGTGTALLPTTAESGESIFNKTAAPRNDEKDNLLYFFSGPETGINPYAPFSLVRSDADGLSNRAILRPETFHITDGSLWAPDGSAVIMIQNDGKSNRFENMVLVPVDPSQPVVTLLADASRLEQTLRWGP